MSSRTTSRRSNASSGRSATDARTTNSRYRFSNRSNASATAIEDEHDARLGEYAHEVYQTLSDLRQAGVDVVTFGQYLQPSRSHLDVFEYVHPDVFETWRDIAEEEMEFLYCASGPMVRSSYKAGELFVDALLREGKSRSSRERARATVTDLE